MGHLFILTPITYLAVILTHRAYQRSGSKDAVAKSLRNFFAVWGVCSVIMGALGVFIGTSFAIGLSLAFGVPFLYLASAGLLFLPFALYKRYLGLAKILSAAVALWAVLLGLIIYANVTGSLEILGPLASFAEHVFANIAWYHLVGLSSIFIPLGVFFFSESAKATASSSKNRTFFLGLGLLIGGVSESFHAFALNPTWFDIVDFGVPIGWLFVLFALLYPRFNPAP